MRDVIRTPVFRSTPKEAAMFPAGSLVRLKVCPDAQPGTVLRTAFRRVVVEWTDVGYIGKHAPGSLILVNGGSK
jgi:hypothetical protein